MVGLASDGTIVLRATSRKDQQDSHALHIAGAMLSRMEPAAVRRVKTEAVIGWLDGLFALPDARPESGAAHA